MTGSERKVRAPHVVLIVSDGTGVTGERVVRAALTQFDDPAILTERVGGVREEAQIVAAVEQAERRDATILFSLVSPAHRRVLLHEARRHHVVTIDLLGPILRHLSEVLETPPRSEPGLFHQLDQEYFGRIGAIDYTLKHDDGRDLTDLASADLVLIGVSRTSKTPLSMYLTNRGWRVANIPIVHGIDPPAELFELPKQKVVALTSRPTWLQSVRIERQQRIGAADGDSYATIPGIREELAWFREILRRGQWQVVDVTHKAIEETAAEIVTLIRG